MPSVKFERRLEEQSPFFIVDAVKLQAFIDYLNNQKIYCQYGDLYVSDGMEFFRVSLLTELSEEESEKLASKFSG